MSITTGVIAAAGSGTRMLPVTLGYPKELLPIINQPALQLIIEEFIASGLKKIVIITGENPAPLHRQYQRETSLPRGKYQPLDEFLDKMSGVEIIFEPQAGPYGNGTPLVVASRHINNGDHFIYAFGDDIIKAPQPFTQQLIDKHHRTGALVVGTQEVPWEDVVRYGIVQLKAGSADLEMEDVVEKPSREEAKSNLSTFGRFLLSTEIIRILKEIPLGKANELWLTDSIREYIRQGGRVCVEAVKGGEWLTIGDPVNYLKTVLEYALSDAEMRAALEPRIRKLLNL
ncbi:MAG: NTP transferase domain-containing protein [Blastocatellia bacterium]|nr:NTP transferase domain-containing protein [Blastocatellia bacterium]